MWRHIRGENCLLHILMQTLTHNYVEDYAAVAAISMDEI